MRESTYLSLGQVAKRLGCRTWQVARLFERGLLPDPPRVGIQRVVLVSELPLVMAKLHEAGYLTVERETLMGI